MYALNQYIRGCLSRWELRGGRPIAEPLDFEVGWLLRISGRAKFAFWMMTLIVLGFESMGFAVRGKVPEREWLLTMAFFAAFGALAIYVVVYMHLYRVEVRPETLSVHRFLLPRRETRWDEITATRYDITETILRFERGKSPPVRIFLTLNGLWTIRKSVVEKCQPPFDVQSWADTEVTLQELAPAWTEPVGEASSSTPA